MARHIDTAEQAKMIRKTLAAKFPGQKFSVRTSRYAGGSSVHVGWTDGPTWRAVENVVGIFAGGGFDGMIDMAYSVDHYLMPDGSVTVARSQGTTGSMGVHEPIDNAKPSPDAELVSFGGAHISCQRSESPEFMETLKATYANASPATRREMLGDAWRAGHDRQSSWCFNNPDLRDFGSWEQQVWYAMARQTSAAALAGFQITDRC